MHLSHEPGTLGDVIVEGIPVQSGTEDAGGKSGDSIVLLYLVPGSGQSGSTPNIHVKISRIERGDLPVPVGNQLRAIIMTVGGVVTSPTSALVR